MLRRVHSTDHAIRVLLSVAVLLPYWRLLSFSVIYVTDAVFTSDIFNGELPGRVLAPGFDPASEVLLYDLDPRSAPVATGNDAPASGRAVITSERSAEVLIETESSAAGYVLLVDTFYPGWQADVDGAPAPVIRASISVRAVPVAEGRHRVRLTFRPTTFINGLLISVA